MKSKDVDEVVAIVNGSETYYEIIDPEDGKPLASTGDKEWATRVAVELGFKVIPRGTPQN